MSASLVFAIVFGVLLLMPFGFTVLLWILKPYAKYKKSIVVWLFWMILATGSSFIFVRMMADGVQEDIHAINPWWLLAALVPLAVMSWCFYCKHERHMKWLRSSTGICLKKNLRLCFGKVIAARFLLVVGCGVSFVLAALASILFSALSLLYAFSFHEGGADKWWMVKIVAMVLLLASLVPAVAFHLNDGRGGSVQRKWMLGGVLSLFICLAVFMPTLFGSISADSMGLLGIRDGEIRRYLVDSEKYPVRVLRNDNWDIWRSEEYGENHYSVEAFSLYAYGAINLLCPATLEPLIFGRNIKKCTHHCIPFRNDEIRKLDAVESEGWSDVRAIATNVYGWECADALEQALGIDMKED